MIGPDATGAGWVYEYALVDRSHTNSLADLRALQDWYLRYQLETVPGVAEVASIGGFVRQYQVNLDPNKLFSYGIPRLDGHRARARQHQRSRRRRAGDERRRVHGPRTWLSSFACGSWRMSRRDQERHAGAGARSGHRGVRAGHSRGAADWNGEGETVGGIVVMRYGMNALNVIDGVKAKFAADRTVTAAWGRDRDRRMTDPG